MSQTNKRTKATDFTRGPQQITENEYNERAGAKKVLGPILGDLLPLGSLAAEMQVQPGSIFAFYNSAAVAGYVKFGTPGLVAPVSAADGVAIPPGQYIVLSAGLNTAMIASAATIFAYQINDDSYIA